MWSRELSRRDSASLPAVAAILAFTLLAATAPGVAASSLHRLRPDGTGDFTTIQEALDSATAGDVIELASGVYEGPGNRDLDPAGKAVLVRSESGNAADCVIDCGGSAQDPHRGFAFRTGETSQFHLEAVTIRSGHAGDDVGGGILCLGGSSPTISGCVLASNGTGAFGGGLYASEASSPILSACVFQGNFAFAAGAAGFGRSSSVLTGCRFEGNDAGSGGALGVYHTGTLTVTGCSFVANTTDAVDCFGGASVLFEGCTFANNDGTGTESPAAIHARSGSSLGLAHTIVAFTSAGAAVSCLDATVSLECCDVFANEAGDWIGCIEDQGNQNDNFSLDPRFCDLATGDMRLRDDSPCGADHSPCGALVGAEEVGCEAVAVRPSPARERVRLEQNRPNPFNPSTVLRFAFEEPGPARLSIFDVAGRRVAILLDGWVEVGSHELMWNGTDDVGKTLPSGVYLARLTASARTCTIRMVLLQ